MRIALVLQVLVVSGVGFLLSAACSSSSSSGGSECGAFCSKLAQGTNCGNEAASACNRDCPSFLQQCPARASRVMGCLTQLAYNCPSQGVAYAKARGAADPDPKSVSGTNWTLYVEDEQCGQELDDFLDCD